MDREKLRRQLHEDIMRGTYRAERAQRFANVVLSLMRDFVPNNRDVYRLINEHLVEIGYQGNLEMIEVPPECDELTKLQLERRRLETHPEYILLADIKTGDDSGKV